MAYEPKDNTGSLFKNERKESEQHPNLTGSIRIDGKDFWISAWTKEHAERGRWLSLAVRPKEEKPTKPVKPKAKTADYDDDIAF